MDNEILDLKMMLITLENERDKAQKYYRNRIDQLKNRINKLIDERNRQLSEKD